MADTSFISWTDATFNPWIGCTRISPACDNCYAATWGRRFGYEWNAAPVRTSASTWAKPRKWDREAQAVGEQRFVFCASLADVFDNQVDPAWRADLLALITATPNLVWLLLTKRIGNVERMVRSHGGLPRNVWIGATIATQAEANRDIPKLLSVRAQKRFLSMEPLLEAVKLPSVDFHCDLCGGTGMLARWPKGACHHCDGLGRTPAISTDPKFGMPSTPMRSIDWVIVGGESGKNARPMDAAWARSIRDQCETAGVDFHFKQWGEFGADGCRVGTRNSGRLLDGVLHDARPKPVRLERKVA